MTEANETGETFTLTDEELQLVREFKKKPELDAAAFRRTIVLALSFSGNQNPTTEDIEAGKENLLKGMREELQSA